MSKDFMNKRAFAASGLAALAFSLSMAAPAAAISTASGAAATDVANNAAAQATLKRLQTRGNAEISRRLTSLNKLAGVIRSTAKLSATDKSDLTSQVSGEISDLTALKTKLDADTTAGDAQTDAQSIITNYRVYALVLPKVYLLKTADAELTNSAKLSTLAGKLQTRITATKNQGKDVTSLQSSLDDMNSQISAAQDLANAVDTAVAPLQPTDYDSDHSILEGQRSQLQTAHQDNQAAYADARTIVSGLKSL